MKNIRIIWGENIVNYDLIVSKVFQYKLKLEGETADIQFMHYLWLSVAVSGVKSYHE